MESPEWKYSAPKNVRSFVQFILCDCAGVYDKSGFASLVK